MLKKERVEWESRKRGKRRGEWGEFIRFLALRGVESTVRSFEGGQVKKKGGYGVIGVVPQQ